VKLRIDFLFPRQRALFVSLQRIITTSHGKPPGHPRCTCYFISFIDWLRRYILFHWNICVDGVWRIYYTLVAIHEAFFINVIPQNIGSDTVYTLDCQYVTSQHHVRAQLPSSLSRSTNQNTLQLFETWTYAGWCYTGRRCQIRLTVITPSSAIEICRPWSF